MPNWREVQQMLKQAKTPQEKQEALKAFGENIPPELVNAHLATMSKGSTNNSVKLGDLAECSGDDEIFERLKDLTSDK